MLEEVDASEMMDQDEEVALELSNWIGDNKGALSLSGVMSLSIEGWRGGWQCYIFCGQGISEERHHFTTFWSVVDMLSTC